ncbi:MAG TPA: hypothetical protein VNY06_02625 [Methylocella sp.]|nr:hypothetical protein [Methylocella sp.]
MSDFDTAFLEQGAPPIPVSGSGRPSSCFPPGLSDSFALAALIVGFLGFTDLVTEIPLQ